MYPSFLLSKIPLLWKASLKFQLLTVYSESWSYHFPLWNIFFTCDIKDLTLCGTQSGLDSWFGLWIEVLQTSIRYVSFFTLMKRVEIISSLVTLGSSMIKRHGCIIDVKFSILMRMWSIGITIDQILSVKLYHTSNGSSFTFTSVSTYLLNKSSWYPSSNPHCVRVRASHMGPIMHIYSHREAVALQGSMGIIPLLWHPLGWDLSERRQLCTLGAKLLSTE